MFIAFNIETQSQTVLNYSSNLLYYMFGFKFDYRQPFCDICTIQFIRLIVCLFKWQNMQVQYTLYKMCDD